MKVAWSDPTLVLQKFAINQPAEAVGSPIIEVIGRSPGLMSSLLTLIGFNPRTHFSVNHSEVRCESASLFRQHIQIIPIRSIGNMQAGLDKPQEPIIIATALVF